MLTHIEAMRTNPQALFDPFTWEEIGRPIWVDRDQWPHLGDIIEELREWWETTGRHLG